MRVKSLSVPNLDDAQILRVVAGLRPCRHGGLRLETEQLRNSTIIHNYGHGGCGITLSMGTAHASADLVDQSGPDARSVAVLGAGIIGLTTARELRSRGYEVTMYAEQVGRETLSMLAGALFLPVGIDLDHPEIGKERFDSILNRSKELLWDLDHDRYGIESMTVFEPAFANDDHRFFENGTIAPPVSHERLPIPGPPRCGHSFETLFVHTPIMIDALLEDLRVSGVRIVNQRFGSIDDLDLIPEKTMVNCMALGSRLLFGDTNLYPARGILVHMHPQDLGYAIHDGYKYMFPRKDALILGGVFDPDVWDDQPVQSIVDEILTHHRRFFAC